ncbi:MAG: hypothetical protein IJS54_07145 [Desulfovibrio sp.]|nr:hypothetical protein [Desulfovibrio sp.]
MEIINQSMDELFRIGIQPNQQLPKSTPSTEQFDDLLQSALAQQEVTEQAGVPQALRPLAEQANMISSMLFQPLGDQESFANESNLWQHTVENASGTLDLFDSYAKTLESPQNANSLREAYAILENIGTQVARLKHSMRSLPTNDSGLSSLINELDVMATTERVKFNRGDYA